MKQLNAGASITSVKSKLIGAFSLTILPILFLGVISARISSNAIKKTSAETIIRTMEQTNRYLELLLWNIESASVQIAKNHAIMVLSNSRDMHEVNEAKTEAREFLNSIKKSGAFISDIVVITASGYAVSTSGYSVPDISLEKFKESGFYKRSERVKGGIVWLGSHPELDEFGASVEKRYSMYAARLWGGDIYQEIKYLIIIDVKYSFIENLLRGIIHESSGEIHLIGPDERDVRISLDNENQVPERPLLVNMPFYKRIRNGTSLNGFDYVEYLGDNYLMTYSRLGTTGYILVGLLPDAALYASSRSIGVSTALLAVAAMVMAISLGLVISFSMGRILKIVASAADRASNGDLAFEVKSGRKDEFGLLAKSISKMVSNMRQLIRSSADFAQNVASSAEIASNTVSQAEDISRAILQEVRRIESEAGKQYAGAEEATVRINELSSKIQAVSDSAGKIGELSNESIARCGNMAVSIRRLSDEYGTATGIIGKIISDIHKLREYSKEIGKLVNIIRSFAEQTGLLSLNAAIEAAHAADMGAGFAVVASEIGKLADMSVKSVHEAENIIKLVNRMIADTSNNASAAENIMKSHNEAFIDTISAFDRVSAAMNVFCEEVSDIMEKVSDMNRCKAGAMSAIGDISAISRGTALSARQLSASINDQYSRINRLADYIRELNAASGKLNESLGAFRIM